ncbi:hypothetical protein [Arthrobacter gengyunqii]|nr:hypothetical protein [Arthrobacter gengyunqii]
MVSEPWGDLHGAWQEVPEAPCVVVNGGEQEPYPLAPSGPAAAAI